MKPPFQSRLLPLCTGQLGLRATLANQVRVPTREDLEAENTARAAGLRTESTPSTESADPIDPAAAIIDLIASDETLDRYHEVIRADGWQLDNYRRNPVFQNSHQYGDIIHTIGRALQTRVINRALHQRIQFAVQENPVAKLAYDLYKAKFLNATSVGFIPLAWEDGARHDEVQRTFTKQELLENSAVSIPANPNALADAYQQGAIEKSTLREIAQLINSLTGAPGPSGDTAPAPPSVATPPETSIRQLADILRKVTRKL